MTRFAHITRPKAGSQWVKDVLADPRILAVQGVRFHQADEEYAMPAFASEPDRAPVLAVGAGSRLCHSTDDRLTRQLEMARGGYDSNARTPACGTFAPTSSSPARSSGAYLERDLRTVTVATRT